MTPHELRAIGLARYGQDWQSPLARAVGCSPRHMRRLAAGQSEITAGMEADIFRALGGAAAAPQDWPRDEWIVGDAGPGGREYVIHARPPRLIARVVAVDADGLPEPGELPADVLGGIVYASDGYVLAEIVWLDAPPPMADIRRMLEAACDAVDASAD